MLKFIRAAAKDEEACIETARFVCEAFVSCEPFLVDDDQAVSSQLRLPGWPALNDDIFWK